MAIDQGYAHRMEMASRISDEEWRQAFLENLPWHREMVAAFRDKD